MTEQSKTQVIQMIGASDNDDGHVVPQLLRTGVAVRGLTRHPKPTDLPGDVGEWEQA